MISDCYITPAVVNYEGNYPYASAAKGESRQKTTPVGIFPSNAFGLYDMHGNLREWCLDEWDYNYDRALLDGSAKGDIHSHDSGKFRPLRGGSTVDYAWDCRSAHRLNNTASAHDSTYGLRVVTVPFSPPSSQSF
jgi:eukaryotic-like serine/threonine-protein kinase